STCSAGAPSSGRTSRPRPRCSRCTRPTAPRPTTRAPAASRPTTSTRGSSSCGAGARPTARLEPGRSSTCSGRSATAFGSSASIRGSRGPVACWPTSTPAALHCGYAPGRTAHGEQFHRAAYALAAMTGNVGVSGGNSGTSNGATGRSGIMSLPAEPNPAAARVASPLLADLLARGKSGGYPADIKLIYSAAGDLFNQLPNVAKTVVAVEQLEFIVVHE